MRHISDIAKVVAEHYETGFICLETDDLVDEGMLTENEGKKLRQVMDNITSKLNDINLFDGLINAVDEVTKVNNIKGGNRSVVMNDFRLALLKVIGEMV